MPQYEYKCNICNKTFELMLSVSKCSNKAICASCGHDCNRIMSTMQFSMNSWKTDVKNYRRTADEEVCYNELEHG